MSRLPAVIGAGCAGAGAVHISLAAQHTGDGWLGTAFVTDGIVLIALGLWVAVAGGRRPVLMAGAACAATAAAYVVAHTVGLPGGHHHDPDVLGIGTTTVEMAMAVAVVAARRPSLTRRSLVGAATAMLALPGVAVALPGDGTAPDGCLEPTRAITLYAEELPRGADGEIRLGYGLTPDAASSPGPLIEMVEGECLAVTLVNHVSEGALRALASDPRWPAHPDQPLGVSLHVHGVKYTKTSDGTLHTGSFVPPGAARTFVWYAAPRVTAGGRVASLGTAGYWWYHDHVAGNDHGTGGLASGLLGGLIVRRAGDLTADRTYVVAMGGPNPTINFASYPDTFICDRDSNRASDACFVAEKGERIEFLVIGIPGTSATDDFHTFHLHGHNWADNRTGMLASQVDETQLIDAKVIGPSETFGFQVVAGEAVGPGDWMLHCHVQQHSDAGMVSFFRVLDLDVAAARQTQSPSLPVAVSNGHADGGHDH